jgi:hypothetical protein
MTTDEALKVVREAGGILSSEPGLHMADLVPVGQAEFNGSTFGIWLPPERVTKEVEWAVGVLIGRWLEAARRPLLTPRSAAGRPKRRGPSAPQSAEGERVLPGR